MRIHTITRTSFLAIISSLFLFSCDEKEEFVTEKLEDYMPLVAGKYITYRLDSMVFTNFGRTIETHRYQVKHQVDGLITDNLGRPSYRVYRYLRDSLGTTPWQPVGTFFVTVLPDQAELIEDNFRYIKLHLPIRDGYTWKGNSYLPADAYVTKYNFSNDDDMYKWDFSYDNFAPTFSYRGINYANVYTVEQIDEALHLPVTPATLIAAKSRAVEKYSKTIGMIYREFELWEYQSISGGSGGGFYTGFGIKMWMIDHN